MLEMDHFFFRTDLNSNKLEKMVEYSVSRIPIYPQKNFILRIPRDMGFTSRFSRKSKVSPNNEDPSPSVSSPINSPATRKELNEKELKKVFERFDANGDEKISASEVNSALSSLGNGLKTEELEKMFSKVDSDGDGLINFDAFLHCYRVLEDIVDSFSLFDVDKNGFITADEFQNLFMTALGEEYSIKECRKLISAGDTDGDGTISYEEFRVMMVSSRFGGGNAGRGRSNP
ncbi:putative calcium-binding protein CML25 [Nicotiana tabacum]|uniref:Calcium-binding protein CML25 n=2 Tax=Nicotiana TaxID=4085 RepID=A0A1S4BGI1_TOBAC|nr:PREDICTED: probable calcium-binding protein CML25 [Nicotiana sylvestris]XP_016487971.1 PREDICTED: probable calcium-binding protein CML25 [Nicotiana tabacum]